MKSIVFLRKLQLILPRQCLPTIYKSFLRPNLDYGDVICDQASSDLSSKEQDQSNIELL